MPTQRVWIVTRDGTRLSANLYLPAARPAPVLLEALPYRKDDLTAESHLEDYTRLRDEGGFAVCRVDLRGTGSSAGRATDEYPATELDDLNDVIAWLAVQPWSSGRVGMFGYSYSAFNSVQLACTRPPALGAICAVYGTDDRYTDDVHYTGGALRGIDLVDYCHYMTVYNALPPVPAVWGDGWQAEWRARIAEHEPWLLRWMAEQTDGDYWRHGSLRPGVDRLVCPTMLVGGWADGYRNNSYRTWAALDAQGTPAELLIGPWAHMAPDRSLPGPHLDLVTEMIRWFRRWLADDPGAPVPPIRLYVQSFDSPAPDLAVRSGSWVGLSEWQPQVHTVRPSVGGEYTVATPPSTGTAAWISCAGSLPWGQPSDQRADDAVSTTFAWPVPDGGWTVVGHPTLRCRLRSDQPVAQLSVKLAEVDPSGTSALVSRGILNLTHRDSSTAPSPVPVGVPIDVTIELDACAWSFAPGHHLRLALACGDWPNIWPAPAAAVLTVDAATLAVDLPLADPAAVRDAAITTTPAPPARPADPDVHWRIARDVLTAEVTCETGYGSAGPLPEFGAYADRYEGVIGVGDATTADMPAASTRAWATARTRCELDFPEGRCAVEGHLRVDADASDYHLAIDLQATLDGQPFGARHWRRTVARHLA